MRELMTLKSEHRAAPGRNRPCPCGSGRKFKVCCETAAPIAAAAHTPEPFIEKAIRDFLLDGGSLPAHVIANSDPGVSATQIEDVLLALRHARESGLRAVLLTIDAFGGPASAGIKLRVGIEAFQARGGHVVAYIDGTAASTLAWAPLVADFVVMSKAKRARIWLHGSTTEDGGAADPAAFAALTRWKLAVLASATLAPVEDLERWIGTPGSWIEHGGMQLDADAALRLGFVDEIGGLTRAREVACALAAGEVLSSPRRRALADRGPLPEFAAALEEVARSVDGIVCRRMTDAESVVPLAWTTPTLASGWHQQSISYPLQYAKDINGTVRFRGGIAPDSLSSTQYPFASALPAGFRPSTGRLFPVWYGAYNDGSVAQCMVNADGTVFIGYKTTNVLSLDTVQFVAEQ